MNAITEYWLEHYSHSHGLDHCRLCWNRGYIAHAERPYPEEPGILVMDYCICPTGQALRENKVKLSWEPK